MRIALTGGTGFIGRRVIRALGAEGAQVVSLGRRPPAEPVAAHFAWDSQSEVPADAVRDCEAVVHLAGEPVAQRWNAAVKQRIRDSRMDSTRRLVDAAGALRRTPSVFVCASAVGYYGDRGEEILTEHAAPGRDFLAEVCRLWEQEAGKAATHGMRHVSVRFGIVLGADGGALAKMLPPFRIGMGGPVGSGRQWVPWIHVEDAAALVRFALHNPRLSGAVNAVAPHPVRNSEFARSLGAALGKPALVPAPEWGLKLLFGEMAKTVVASQHVVPEAARHAGFEHRFRGLDAAFADLLRAG
jgi:uncharacterized protein (TIGR01777 family)